MTTGKLLGNAGFIQLLKKKLDRNLLPEKAERLGKKKYG
ncbi:MAG: hypothetical protein IEMM0003_0106 [bacterium]|nr:MAG: hypothetical protein IEMM0003_0106 [bacterium]